MASRTGAVALEREESRGRRRFRSATCQCRLKRLAFGVVSLVATRIRGDGRLSAGQTYCGCERLGCGVVGELVL